MQNLIINAVIGDTITIDAAVWATIGGTEELSGLAIDDKTWVFMRADLDMATVPIPGAVWLLGSGLIGLIGIRRKFRKA